MKNKGFTLIELLAVIVILAIIALIATPIILNIINDSKSSSTERSADLYLKSFLTSVTQKNMEGEFNPSKCVVQSDGNALCDGTVLLTIEMSGEMPSEGEIFLEGGKIIDFKNLKYESVYLSKGTNGGYDITNEKKTSEPSGPRIITFTYNGDTVQAEEGMTWGQFIHSDYNIIYLTEGGMYGITTGMVTDRGLKDDETNMVVQVTDVIKEGGSYSDYSECCFDPDTQILMADGTTKNIQDVKVGDMVMSYNIETNEYEEKRVLRTIVKHNSDDLVYINLSNGTSIGMRAYHPLLTIEGYKSLRPELVQTVNEAGHVEKLQVGDTLVGYNENLTIVSIEKRENIENYDTYNLSVEDNNNYIVNGVVVHNATCAPSN